MKNIDNIELIIEGIRQGRYSLFLGAGVSRDSYDSKGNRLSDGDKFRRQLCSINNLPESTPLAQAAQLLSDEDKDNYITKVFSNTIPGKTYDNFCDFIWKNIYTLNVDDCIENSYRKCQSCKQKVFSKNYKDVYEQNENLGHVQIVHLHGFSREPEKGYVFNLNEYINNIREQNSWYKVFANSFASSPYIVSGISFNEPDFIFYVNQRNNIIRDGFCPSILIEPNPNKLTQKLCEKHGLQLIEMTFGEFLAIIKQSLPEPPDVFALSIEKNKSLLEIKNLTKDNIVAFYKDFTEIKKTDGLNNGADSLKFALGAEPAIVDIENHADIHREVTTSIYKRIKKELQNYGKSFVLLTGKFYSGKTTSILSAIYQLSLEKYPVFRLKSVNGFNVINTIECLNSLDKKSIVFIDNLSDYIEQVEVLFKKLKNVILIGAERNYRKTHIENVLSSEYIELNSDKLNLSEIKDLFNKYRLKGINTQKDAISNPDKFIKKYSKQTIGEYACLLVNNFKPIEDSIPQLYNELTDYDKEIYVAVVLAYHSYRVGIHYEVLESMLPRNYNLWNYFKKNYPLKLIFNNFNDEEEKNYIIPENKVLADCTFQYLLNNDIATLQRVYKELLNSLSYYVNRITLKQHTAEARLAGRLFDIDNMLERLFKDNPAKVLEEVQEKWEWNSRYWEQRALATYNKDIDKALLHAEQAVAIELHPNTLTTLAKIQFKIMENTQNNEFVEKFKIACDTALQAMNLEITRTYITIHPFIVLKNGIDSFLHRRKVSEIDNSLRENIKIALTSYITTRHFPYIEKQRIESLIEEFSK